MKRRSKIILGSTAVLLIAIFFQSTRSSWYGTAAHLQRLFSFRVLHTGRITGHAITARLNVPFHRQQHSLSCEIAALKMALAAQGVDIPESELISKLDFDKTKRSKSVWGDPYTGFVGGIDGRMGVTGYGVYWDPIAKVGNNYLKSEVIDVTPQILAQHINEGRAIVSWGYFGRGKKLSWKTPAGKQINAINGEHARTVIGFSGDVDDPTGFIILDPIYGEQYWSTTDLFKNWAPFENKGVVVYANEELTLK